MRLARTKTEVATTQKAATKAKRSLGFKLRASSSFVQHDKKQPGFFKINPTSLSVFFLSEQQSPRHLRSVSGTISEHSSTGKASKEVLCVSVLL